MADRIESLKSLATEYNIRSPAKLRQQALIDGVNVTLKEAQQALANDTARQAFAPKRRPQGKSAAPDVNSRLQHDLIDFSNNTSNKNQKRFALVGIDVFSREVASQPLPSKAPEVVNEALKKTQEALVVDEKNFAVTTDLGAEFPKIEDVLPSEAIWRQKTPEDRNAIGVLDRNSFLLFI